ncbi:hypothetical protein PMAYCL1PPCAC_05085, partial [Pristionchus mayeri]
AMRVVRRLRNALSRRFLTRIPNMNHFIFNIDGNSHRFMVSSTCEEMLTEGKKRIRNYIVCYGDPDLVWNDGISRNCLRTEDDIATAIDFAKEEAKM